MIAKRYIPLIGGHEWGCEIPGGNRYSCSTPEAALAHVENYVAANRGTEHGI